MPWLELAPSIKGHQVRRWIPDELKQFGSLFPRELFFHQRPFWDVLAEVINVPYEDYPLSYGMSKYVEKTKGKTICRTNHDVAHSIRKLIYLDVLFREFLPVEKTAASSYLQSLSIEEYNLLLLMMFLERSGRTNEESSSVDPTIMNRSAEIFKSIAVKELVCSEEKVHQFTKILLGVSSSSVGFFAAENSFVNARDRFLHYCLITAHHLDLLRCRRKADVEYWIERDLAQLLPEANPAELEQKRKLLISIAEYACEVTGTRFDPNTGGILADDHAKKLLCIEQPGVVIEKMSAQVTAISSQLLAASSQVRHCP